MFIQELVGALERHGVLYALVGGVAGELRSAGAFDVRIASLADLLRISARLGGPRISPMCSTSSV